MTHAGMTTPSGPMLLFRHSGTALVFLGDLRSLSRVIPTPCVMTLIAIRRRRAWARSGTGGICRLSKGSECVKGVDVVLLRSLRRGREGVRGLARGQVSGGVDQPDVGECLGEVADQALAPGVVFLGKELDIV